MPRLIYNTFYRTLDERNEVRAVFCDAIKALDRVWHNSLLYKLKSAGINGTLLQWFTDYLKDRRWGVALPGASSDWCLIKTGVQQGFLDFCCSRYS